MARYWTILNRNTKYIINMKKIVLISVVLLGIVFTSCRKDFEEQPEMIPETMDQLVVPSNFDWKTTRDISINFTAGSKGIVEVTSSNGVAYQKAFLQADAAYTMMITIPSYEKEVLVKFNGRVETVALDNPNINFQF